MKAGVHVMELPRRECRRLCILVLYFSIATTTLFTQCDARRARQVFKFEGSKHQNSSIINATKKLKLLKHLDMNPPLDPTNDLPYGVSSPFSLPPFDSLAPFPLPENTPPFCENPPLTPQPSTTTIPTPIVTTQPPPPPPPPFYLTPIFPIQSPPPSPPANRPCAPEYSPIPNPPEYVPSPPSNVPILPEYVPRPPSYVPNPPESVPSPPGYGPSPPEYVPSPGRFVPSPPVFQPPVVFPPPSVPPPPYKGPALWCVAKPSVPDPIIQEAMNYACGSGADCDSIQPDGSCYHPDTLFAHASYAFNSYWQMTKVTGGRCDFGGTGMLVTVDPSFHGCHFIYH